MKALILICLIVAVGHLLYRIQEEAADECNRRNL